MNLDIALNTQTQIDLKAGLKKDFDVFGANLIVASSPTALYNRLHSDIDALADINVKSVLLCLFLNVDSPTGHTLTRTFTDGELNDTIDYCQSKNIEPIIKIHVYPPSTNIAEYNPTNKSAFFTNFQTELLYIGNIAYTQGIKYMTISNEMLLLTTTTYNSNWDTITKALRKAYSNIKLGCSCTYEEMNGFTGTGLLNYVDVIGWNIYPWISNTGTDDTVEDLVRKWQKTTNGYDFLYVLKRVKRRYPDKEIWFTEFGCLGQSDALEKTSGTTGTYDQNYNIMYKYYLASFYYWANSGLLDKWFFWVANGGHGYNPLNWDKTKKVAKQIVNASIEKRNKDIYQNKTMLNRWITAKELNVSPIKSTSGTVNLFNLHNDRANGEENIVIYLPPQTGYTSDSALSLNFSFREFLDLDKTYEVSLLVKKESDSNVSAQILCDIDKVGTFRYSLNNSYLSSARYKVVKFYIAPNRSGGRTLIVSDFVSLNIACIKNSIDSSTNGFYLSAIKIKEVETFFTVIDSGGNIREIQANVSTGALELKATKTAYADFYTDAAPANLILNGEMNTGTGTSPNRVATSFTSVNGSGTTNVYDVTDHQSIQITASTIGNVKSYVTQTITGLTAGDVMHFGVQAMIENVVGTFIGRFVIEFLNSSNGSLGAYSTTFSNTTYDTIYITNKTAPANTAKVIVYLQAFSQAINDVGIVRFKNVNVYKNVV